VSREVIDNNSILNLNLYVKAGVQTDTAPLIICHRSNSLDCCKRT
jgi:hypothetical protein